ncbi:hypothetical protein, partial [Kineococcus esterisolvens]|uniref:hypothetical protein n=1 Tax=Kineococcus sp. SYSU DK011 TaxID=3383132 RepID=UPI003D7C9CCA
MSTAPALPRSAGRSPSRDGLRRGVVAAGALVAVAGSAVGSGAFGGTPIAEAAGGALSADATLVAPAGPAFAIWSVVYAGLVALAVWQLLPAHTRDARQRATGWWVAASLVLNPVWIATVQAGWVGTSVLVIAALLAVLVVAFGRLVATGPHSRVEAVVVDGTVGLYLGWVGIAAVANTAAWLGQTRPTGAEPAWAVTVLALTATVGGAHRGAHERTPGVRGGADVGTGVGVRGAPVRSGRLHPGGGGRRRRRGGGRGDHRRGGGGGAHPRTAAGTATTPPAPPTTPRPTPPRAPS